MPHSRGGGYGGDEGGSALGPGCYLQTLLRLLLPASSRAGSVVPSQVSAAYRRGIEPQDAEKPSTGEGLSQNAVSVTRSSHMASDVQGDDH